MSDLTLDQVRDFQESSVSNPQHLVVHVGWSGEDLISEVKSVYRMVGSLGTAKLMLSRLPVVLSPPFRRLHDRKVRVVYVVMPVW